MILFSQCLQFDISLHQKRCKIISFAGFDWISFLFDKLYGHILTLLLVSPIFIHKLERTILNDQFIEASIEIVQDVLRLLEHTFEEIFLMFYVLLIYHNVELLRRCAALCCDAKSSVFSIDAQWNWELAQYAFEVCYNCLPVLVSHLLQLYAISWIILAIFQFDAAEVQFIDIEVVIALAYAQICYVDVHLFVVCSYC